MPQNLESLLRPHIQSLKPYTSARDEYAGAAHVWLDANENPVSSPVNRYPDPYQRVLKEQVAKLKGIAPERLFLGNGSDEAIDLLIRLFCRPGEDGIIICPPTYGMYAVSARLHNAAVTEVLLDDDFQPDPEAILAAAQPGRDKLLFLCSPNNPTGNTIEASRLRHLLEAFPGIVVLDEAYIDFARTPSCLPWLADHPHLVVMHTFSKAWGMAGLRLGMAAADPRIIGWLNKIKAPYNLNQLTLDYAEAQLRDPQAFEESLAMLKQERRRVLEALHAMHELEAVYPTEGNFVLVQVDDPDGLYEALLARGIVVRNRSRQPKLAGCLRLTIGTPQENDDLLDALRSLLPA